MRPRRHLASGASFALCVGVTLALLVVLAFHVGVTPLASVTPALAAPLPSLALVVARLGTPVDGDKVSELEASPGVRIVGYLGDGRYLLWTSASARRGLDIAGVGRSTSPDAVARITPFSPGTPAKSNSRYLVLYIVDRGENAGSYGELRRSGLLRGGADLGALRAAIISRGDTAQDFEFGMPDLVAKESFDLPTLQDERQGMLIAGSRSQAGTGPRTPGYRQWLRSRGFSVRASDYPIIDIVDDGLDNGSTDDPEHSDFRAFGVATADSRIVFNDDLTPDDDPSGVDGHGTLNASIAVGFGSSTAGKQDDRGFDYGLGISPFGRVGSTKTFRKNGRWETSLDFDEMALRSYALGSRISSNSWGDGETHGDYGFLANLYDHLVRDSSSDAGAQQMTTVFASGNYGPARNSVSDPGTAKNVITVGASENRRPDFIFDGCGVGPAEADDVRDMVDFSGRGPTDDGRIKPEVVAPGSRITGAASQTPFFTGSSVCGTSSSDHYFPSGQTLYTWSSGTSHATPAVAGVASLIHEYFVRKTGKAPSPAMVRALLVNGARYLTGDGAGDRLPSNSQGFGAVDLLRLTDSAPKLHRDETSVITRSGEVESSRFVITDPKRPVRVTLAWTDPPGTPGASRALVNDLDLEVLVDGRTYKGNVFSRSSKRYSQAYAAGAGGRDRLNNIEAVFLPTGTTGRIDIRVRGRDIAGDGALGLPGSPEHLDLTDQDYALTAHNVSRSERLSLTRSDWVVRWGSAVRLSGRLVKKDGTPIRSARVRIHERSNSGVWHALTSVRTDSGGRFSLRVKPGADRHYRAFYWGGSGLSAAASTPGRVRVRPRLTVASSSAGSGKARLSGSVSPNHRGKLVYLQYRSTSSSRWRFLAKVRVNPASRFGAVWEPAHRGRYKVRAKLPAHSDHATGVSSQIRVAVR